MPEPKTRDQWQAAVDLAALYRLLAATNHQPAGYDDLRIDYLLGAAGQEGIAPAPPETLMERYLRMPTLPPLP